MKNESGTILFLSNDASRTGAPIFLLRLLRWLRQNHDYSFRTLVGRYGDLVPDFEALGPVDSFEPKPTAAYKVLRRLKLNGSYRAKHQQALRAKLSRCDIRLIYCNTIANGKILDFLSFLRCPVICHVHELESVIHDFGQQNMDSIRKYTAKYIAVSQAVKSNLLEKHKIPEDKICLISGFIPQPEGPPQERTASRSAVRQELGIPVGSKLICGSGSIEHRKGADLFLKIAGGVKEATSDNSVHFVWIGGRPDRVAQMQKEIRSSPLQDVVHFIGSRASMIPYYDASDLFLLSSREDPFPLVMLEAASRCLPILCFADSGGAPEFVENDAGVVVPNFDTAHMAKEVIRLLSAPEFSGRLGNAGQQKVMNRFTLDRGAPKIAQVIRENLTESEDYAEAQLFRSES
jgi:glycosyltransferase involved in cell wall biosynthesis